MFFFVFLGSHVAVAESLHKLKGRIIRALAVEAGRASVVVCWLPDSSVMCD